MTGGGHVAESPVLTTVNGCQLVYNIRTHHQLQKVMHLMPENVIIGANDILPGIAEGFRSGRTPGLGRWDSRWGSISGLGMCHVA